MTGWIVATATAAAFGAVGVGAALESGTREQSPAWRGDVEIASLMPEAEQAFSVFGGTGSQIGVSIRDFNDDELKAGKAAAGVVIEDVEADSPAQKAGFKAGDIVVEFDGERVRSTRQFMRLVQETPSGRSIPAAVTRDGQRVTLNVQPRSGGSFKFWDGSSDSIFAMPAPKVAPPMVLKRDAFPPSFESFMGSSGQLGISVDELSPQLSEYFGAKEGVLVTTVRENSTANKAGVKAGDVITSLNGATVTTAADLRRRAQRLEGGDEFTLAIVRDKKPMTLKGKVEPPAARRSSMRTIV
jgi:S1-C subfamily serine protease